MATDFVEPRTDGFHSLRVAAVDHLCDDAVAVTFDVPDDLRGAYAFRPGQFLTLRQHTDNGEERRSYSICAPLGAAPRVGVRRVTSGLFSEWLVDRLEAGDEVDVGPPSGSFTPDLEPGTHHGLIAAGSGITPVLSIAASLLAAHNNTRVTLLYGNRRTDTVMFTEELADLKNTYTGGCTWFTCCPGSRRPRSPPDASTWTSSANCSRCSWTPRAWTAGGCAGRWA